MCRGRVTRDRPLTAPVDPGLDPAAAIARRRALLVAALGFARARVSGEPGALAVLAGWLGSWRGLGAVAAGMARQGYDLQLTKYADDGWRANFYPAGLAHSVVAGTGWDRAPWSAVQAAAWQALGRE